MKHNLKMPDGTIKAVDCKLGTGIKDKYGREIFEGARVSFSDEYSSVVTFEDGSFFINDRPIWRLKSSDLEIVGHVDD